MAFLELLIGRLDFAPRLFLYVVEVIVRLLFAAASDLREYYRRKRA